MFWQKRPTSAPDEDFVWMRYLLWFSGKERACLSRNTQLHSRNVPFYTSFQWIWMVWYRKHTGQDSQAVHSQRPGPWHKKLYEGASDDNDPTSSDFGGSIKRFLEKLAPGQTRIYCKAIPEDLRSVDKSGNSKFFYANQPVRKNLISDLFKEGADMLGLPNPKKIAPHCLRSYMVTKIANGKGKYLNFFLVFFLFNF